MNFARQDVPTSFQCGLWQRLLRHLLHPASCISVLRLHQSLGLWTAESTMRWGAMMWHSTLYRCNPSLVRDAPDTGRYISVHHPRVDGIYMLHNRTDIPPQYQHKPLLPKSPVATHFRSPVPLAHLHLSDRRQQHSRNGFNSFCQQREDSLSITPLRNAMLSRHSFSIYKYHVLSLWVLMEAKNIMTDRFRGFCAP
jgi:hypothetical protein